MSQKGFATFFGLCLILAVALCAKSIQESETNYSYAAADYQMEFELQNAAISGIYEAAEYVSSGKVILDVNEFPTYGNRRSFQVEVVKRTINRSDEKYRLKKIYLTVWGERLESNDQKIMHYKRLYPSRELEKKGDGEAGYILFSVAESSNGRMDGKIYRRAFAYVLSEGDKKIYFMEPKESD